MGNDQSSTNNEHSSSPQSSLISSFPKPTKSAMRKSRSTRHHDHELPESNRNKIGRSRYIPHMNPPTVGNGFAMPSRPFARYSSVDNKMLGSNGAEMSPQWGWYINTTPPTPELYHSKSNHQSFSSAGHQSNHLIKGDQTASTGTVLRTGAGTSCQNQVFQNLQNSTKTNRMGGWTSVPIWWYGYTRCTERAFIVRVSSFHLVITKSDRPQFVMMRMGKK